MLEGLAAAHRVGVIHRDLKPENIFLTTRDGAEPLPKLLDFGIARIDDGGTRQTMEGSILGTPAYMSPEQFGGQPTEEPADIWGATATLYEALTGRPPFGDDQLASVMQRVLSGPVPYPKNVAGLDGRLPEGSEPHSEPGPARAGAKGDDAHRGGLPQS